MCTGPSTSQKGLGQKGRIDVRALLELRFACQAKDTLHCRTDLLAIGLTKGGTILPAAYQALDKALGGALTRLLASGDLKPEVGASSMVYPSGKLDAKRVLVVGLGDPDLLGPDQFRKAAAVAGSVASSVNATSLGLAIHHGSKANLDPEVLGRALAEGASYGAYRYDEFVTGPAEGRRASRMTVILIEPDRVRLGLMEKGFRQGAIVGQATNMARTWSNRPANLLRPADLAAIAKAVARDSSHLTCKVRNEDWLRSKGMGGILAVGAGSANRPSLIELSYRPAKTRPSQAIGLVGKAVTFDSGGISIKPAADMDQMKLDKSGGAVVIATIKAIDQLGLGVRVLGLIPAVENLPSGTSYRPGDIITTFSGKTVEVVNTDAEGRLILCDALSYAAAMGCDIIVDIATLTGACMVALGRYMAGLMGNDKGLIEAVQEAARSSGEQVWPLPCGPEYQEEIKGKITDLRNTGSKWGGACTAAAFLRQFVGKARWVHLDIAGVDMLYGKDWSAQGASGFGVRLLTDLIKGIAEKA